MAVIWRERSTIILLLMDCPFVPVPPPRGVKVSNLYSGKFANFVIRTISATVFGKRIA